MNQVETIYERLRVDPEFEYSRHTRGIVLPTEVITGQLFELAKETIDIDAQSFLLFAIEMLRHVGDKGIFIKVTKVGNRTDIELRGNSEGITADSSTEEFLKGAYRHENSIEITPYSKRPLRARVWGQGDTNQLQEQVDTVVNQIPEMARDAVVKGILTIVNDQLDQVLDA
jgi:hypothetical protein